MKKVKLWFKTVLLSNQKFFKKYHEFITFPIAIGLWLLSIPLLRAFDPTAAVFDAGIFQIPLFAVIQLMLFLTASWLILKIVFGTFHKFMIEDMKYNFDKLTSWQKIRLSYFIYFLLLAALVLLTRSAI